MTRLFDPITLGRLSLRNRTVMAPMTRRQSPGGIPTPEVGGCYRRRAQISDPDWVAKIESGWTDELQGFNAADLTVLT